MAVAQANAAYATGSATHRTHIVSLETHGLAFTAEQHNVTTTVGNCGTHQHIAFIQFDGSQANTALAGKIGQRRFLHGTIGRCHKDVVSFRILFHRQDRGDALALFQGQQIDHGSPT